MSPIVSLPVQAGESDGGSPHVCCHHPSWDWVTRSCPAVGDTHTQSAYPASGQCQQQGSWGLGGSPGVRAGPVAVFNPCKCLREAASGIRWIMPAGAEGGCGTDGADDNGAGGRQGQATPPRCSPRVAVPAPDWDTAIPCQLSPLSLRMHLSGCGDTIQGLALFLGLQRLRIYSLQGSC